MSIFKQFLEDHHIDPLRLSCVAGVRYLTIWNATQGNAITQEHAQKIRVALRRLTGTTYVGPLFTIEEKQREQIPTLPFRKIPRHS